MWLWKTRKWYITPLNAIFVVQGFFDWFAAIIVGDSKINGIWRSRWTYVNDFDTLRNIFSESDNGNNNTDNHFHAASMLEHSTYLYIVLVLKISISKLTYDNDNVYLNLIKSCRIVYKIYNSNGKILLFKMEFMEFI